MLCAIAVHFFILLIAFINLIFILFNSETKPNMLPNYFSFEGRMFILTKDGTEVISVGTIVVEFQLFGIKEVYVLTPC